MINLESLLNIKIDKIYCISIKERQDRRNFLKTQFSKLDHEITFHIVERNKDPVRGCLESHIDCIKEARELGLTNILMLEDDILINEKILEDIKSIHVPKNFDMFYLGYHINDGIKYGNNLLKLLSAQTTHAYIMNNKIFDFVINNIEKEWDTISEWQVRNKYESRTNFNVRAIDLFYAKWIHHQRGNTYGIYPILIHQKPDYSDIEKRNIDYRVLMDSKAKEFIKVKPYEFDTWILNLERRKDRWVKMQELVSNNGLNGFKIKAIDGRGFNFEKYMDLFSLRDFKLRVKNPYHTHERKRGVLGCALSHYKMWESISSNKNLNNEDFILVVEDDCNFKDNFSTHLNLLLDELKFKTWDICYIGYTDYVELEDDKEEGNNLIKLSGSRRLRGGGTFGYFITKMGAKKLFDIANDRNIQQAIDWFMIEQYDKINAYKTKNDLIFSNVAGVRGHDSDVQNVNSKKEFMNIEMEYFNYNKNNFLKDQYNNLYQMEESFNVKYFGRMNEANKIQIRQFHNNMTGIKFENKGEYVIIYAGKKMKYFIHYFAKYFTNIGKNVLVFHNNFDYKFDGIQYVNFTKFDKLNEALKFKNIFIFDLSIFLYNFMKNYNKLILIEDGELFFDSKFNNIILPSYGVYLLQNFLHKIHKIYATSKTVAHYFKQRTGIIEDIPILPALFTEEKMIIEPQYTKTNINKSDILFISYDQDVKSIINFFNKLNIKNKKLLLFSDIYQSTNDNLIIKPRIFKGNLSYLKHATFFITQTKKIDEYNLINIALSHGVICVISSYYTELSNKTITFSDNLNEVKEKVETSVNTLGKREIYKKIGKTYFFNLSKQLEKLDLFN